MNNPQLPFTSNPPTRPALRRAKIGIKVIWDDLRTRRFLVPLAKKGLRLRYQNAPVPLDKVLALQRLSSAPQPLLPHDWTVKTDGKALRNSFLADRLAKVEFGKWRLSAAALNFLEQEIQQARPRAILEFGSGVSTVCLAHYMRELYGDRQRRYVISIDQEHQYAEETTRLLASHGLEQAAQVIYAPLREQVIEGMQTICYDFSDIVLTSPAWNDRPDFVVIDGPAAEGNARFGTLPLVRSLIDGEARFFLDDALREEELSVAGEWKKLAYLQIDGLHLLAKGILAGHLIRQVGPDLQPPTIQESRTT